MAHVSTNERLIESRTRLGKYASFGGLAVILAGLVASLQNNIVLAYGALILGFIISNIGAYFLNRYGLKPHEKLIAALKGLDKRYRLYNFILPVPHVLLTPYSVTVILVKNQDGAIVGDQKGWRQGNSLLRVVRWFSSEPLGNPPKELESQKQQLRDFLEENMEDGAQIPIEGYVIFANPNVRVTLTNNDDPVVVLNQQPDALKSLLRRDKRTAGLPGQEYQSLVELFDKETETKSTEVHSLFPFWRR